MHKCRLVFTGLVAQVSNEFDQISKFLSEVSALSVKAQRALTTNVGIAAHPVCFDLHEYNKGFADVIGVTVWSIVFAC